jgi:hypothetical protein
MDRRRFLKTAAGLFVPAIPAIIRPGKLWAQGGMGPGPGMVHSTGGGGLGLQTSLGSFFSLDNTLADATGAVTNLTNNGTVTFVSPPGGGLAAVTNCANFVAASSQYLSHADATGINIVGVDSSIQFWYYATGNSNFFASKSTGGFGSREFQISYGFGTGSANPVSTDINNGTAAITANVSNSAWHHYVLTRNNATNGIIVYIDGSSAATASSGAAAGTSQLNIGANATPGNYWAGNIALFGVWRNRILSAGDVTLLYNGGAGLSYAAMA